MPLQLCPQCLEMVDPDQSEGAHLPSCLFRPPNPIESQDFRREIEWAARVVRQMCNANNDTRRAAWLLTRHLDNVEPPTPAERVVITYRELLYEMGFDNPEDSAEAIEIALGLPVPGDVLDQEVDAEELAALDDEALEAWHNIQRARLVPAPKATVQEPGPRPPAKTAFERLMED